MCKTNIMRLIFDSNKYIFCQMNKNTNFTETPNGKTYIKTIQSYFKSLNFNYREVYRIPQYANDKEIKVK